MLLSNHYIEPFKCYFADSRGIKAEDIPHSDILKILKDIGLENVKLYSESEIKGEKK